MDKFGLKQQQHRVAAPTIYQRFTTWWYSKFTYPRNTGGLREYTGKSINIAPGSDRSLFNNGAGSGRLRHGKGELTLTSYDTIDGEWNRDYPIGQMTWEEKYRDPIGQTTWYSTYEGVLRIEKYERNYYRFKKYDGTITYHDTGDVDTYTGTFDYDGRVNGRGKITYHNGNVYVGNVKMDVNSRVVPDGQGTMTYKDGTKEIGTWKYGLRLQTSRAMTTVSPSTLAIPRGSISFGNPVVEPPPAPIARVAPSPSPSSQTIFENPVLFPSKPPSQVQQQPSASPSPPSPIFAMVAPSPQKISVQPSAPPAPPSPVQQQTSVVQPPFDLPLPPTTPPLSLPPPPTTPLGPPTSGRRNSGRNSGRALPG